MFNLVNLVMNLYPNIYYLYYFPVWRIESKDNTTSKINLQYTHGFYILYLLLFTLIYFRYTNLFLENTLIVCNFSLDDAALRLYTPSKTTGETTRVIITLIHDLSSDQKPQICSENENFMS